MTSLQVFVEPALASIKALARGLAHVVDHLAKLLLKYRFIAAPACLLSDVQRTTKLRHSMFVVGPRRGADPAGKRTENKRKKQKKSQGLSNLESCERGTLSLGL